ncbi:hypothetical protein EMCG_06571 [[Emmonsia] crescens]|uniref:Uncharacterized protein n=1 Tax=[Emmonsia] crescens TaxID=73230 RepID=A0A0G2IBZ1_9EURO|nr:hypothetical protein EMCG_06571 [Emmonsia crescens UAMH 3008]
MGCGAYIATFAVSAGWANGPALLVLLPAGFGWARALFTVAPSNSSRGYQEAQPQCSFRPSPHQPVGGRNQSWAGKE